VVQQQGSSGENMDRFISVAVLTLGELFSDTYHFHLPWFQRAYAWREEHVGRLLADIVQAQVASKPRYSLGDLCIAKVDGRPQTALIDGQQRAITLTILFALLRDLAPEGPQRSALGRLVSESDQSGAARYRIVPQPGVVEFFRRYVQAPGGTLLEPEDAVMSLAESERYILWNRNHLRVMLAQHVPTPEARSELASFLLTLCFVVVKSVADENEAWQMVSTQEETGLAHHSSERAKVSLISAMPRTEQEEAGQLYEECQRLIGADQLLALLGHVSVLKRRKRLAQPVEKDLLQLFAVNRSGLPLLKEELLPRAEKLAEIRSRVLKNCPARVDVSRSLQTLLWLEREFWVTPALHWLGTRGAAHRETALFFRRLDRLAWVARLAGMDPTDEEKRFIRLINEIDEYTSVDQMPALEIPEALRKDMLDRLRSRTFYSKHYNGLVLRRINRNLGSDPGPVDGENVTIEHVLPLSAKAEGWKHIFKTEEQVREYAHRLGNLAYLTHPENLEAGNREYRAKRKILRRTSFLLSKLAARDHNEWTANVIARRTEQLINILLSDWQIAA
jgi:hypothetical protein